MGNSLFNALPIGGIIGIIIAVAVVFVIYFIIFATRYKKCPSDKIMVIYGNVGKNSDGTMATVKCIHGGAAFIWPFVQAYKFLDLNPYNITIQLSPEQSQSFAGLKYGFSFGISTERGAMQIAAERLLGLSRQEIQDSGQDIIRGQIGIAFYETGTEEILASFQSFNEKLMQAIQNEFDKIGIRLINARADKIFDKSGNSFTVS